MSRHIVDGAQLAAVVLMGLVIFPFFPNEKIGFFSLFSRAAAATLQGSRRRSGGVKLFVATVETPAHSLFKRLELLLFRGVSTWDHPYGTAGHPSHAVL